MFIHVCMFVYVLTPLPRVTSKCSPVYEFVYQEFVFALGAEMTALHVRVTGISALS